MSKNGEFRTEEERENEKEKQIKKVDRSERSVKRYQYLILRILLLVAVLWILFFKVIGLTHMPSDDMYPRIDAGDMVMFYRLDKDVKVQDVIVFEKATPHNSTEQLFVGRVAAGPGDTIEITDGGIVKVNDNALSEAGIFYKTQPYEGYVEFPVTLGPDECFVLSDRREGGSDSRYFGPVRKSEIQGSVITILRRNNL